MSLIWNEQTKLTATFLNGSAMAIFAVGGLTPTVKFLAEPEKMSAVPIVAACLCYFGALALHLGARSFLKRLKP